MWKNFSEWWTYRAGRGKIITGPVGTMLAIAALLFIILADFLVWLYLQPHTQTEKKDFAQVAATLDAGIVLLGQMFLAGLNLQVTRDTANQKADSDREGQITERFTRAVEQLGNESIVVRSGGIYALARIMKDSPRDQATIVEILSAYVREHGLQTLKNDEAMNDAVTLRNSAPSGSDPARLCSEEYTRIRGKVRIQTDVQAALYALGRRESGGRPVFLPALDFSWLLLSDVRMLWHFEGANFFGGTLTRVVFYNAYLTETQFQYAVLDHVQFVNTTMDSADFTGAAFTRVLFSNTDLSKALGLTQEQINGSVFGSGVILPPGLHPPEPPPGSPVPPE